MLAGKLGEAISTVDQLYPGLLALNQDLHFRLKVNSGLVETKSFFKLVFFRLDNL